MNRGHAFSVFRRNPLDGFPLEVIAFDDTALSFRQSLHAQSQGVEFVFSCAVFLVFPFGAHLHHPSVDHSQDGVFLAPGALPGFDGARFGHAAQRGGQVFTQVELLFGKGALKIDENLLKDVVNQIGRRYIAPRDPQHLSATGLKITSGFFGIVTHGNGSLPYYFPVEEKINGFFGILAQNSRIDQEKC